MQLRELGRSGLKVSPLCFGGNVFGWTVDEARSFELLDAFVDGGFNFIDTADVYSRWMAGNQGGESETILGNWMKSRGNRSKLIIATKVGMEMRGEKGLSPAHIRKSVEGSLQRLQTDVIDLYQAHRPDPDTSIEETLVAFAELVKAGKVRAIGASNYDAPGLQAALDASERLRLPPYESLQPEYNLYTRAGFEQALEPLCRRQGIGVIPYYSLASGFLTGKYRGENDFGKSARGAGVKKYLDARGFKILAALDAVAAETNATLAQIALAWLMARPGITAPIASATTRVQLSELIGAVNVKLDTGAIARLNEVGAAT